MAAREPFTVRLSTDLVAAVRARARDEGNESVATLVDAALRLYLSSSQAKAERAALLDQVEEDLIERLDRRLARAIEGIRDVAVKANYDQSLTLVLLGEVVYALFSHDKQAYQEITQRTRKEAAKRLQRVSALSSEAESVAVADLKKELADQQSRYKELLGEKETWKAAAQRSREETERHKAEAEHWERVASWERGRYGWAKQHVEAQQKGVFERRKSLDEFLQEYERSVPRPTKRAPA